MLDRAAQLMAELGGGAVARGVLDAYPAPRPHRRLGLRLARVERVIGGVPAARGGGAHPARRSASRWTTRATTLQVVVPSFRRDIHQEDDLVEEIVRIWGYDKIPLTLAGAARSSRSSAPPGSGSRA